MDARGKRSTLHRLYRTDSRNDPSPGFIGGVYSFSGMGYCEVVGGYAIGAITLGYIDCEI